MRTRPADPGGRPRRPAGGGAAWRLVAVARPWLAGAVLVGLGQAVLLVAQAGILARLLTAAMDRGLSGRAAAVDCVWLVVLAVGQGVLGWAWEAFTEAAARRVRAATRRQALTTAIRLAASGQSPEGGAAGVGGTAGFGGTAGLGGMTTLLGSGVDELDPFIGRVLPRTVLALAVPALLLAWIGHLDLVSVGLAALVLVIGPMLAGLVGADTAAAVRRRLASLERLGDRFDALVGGLPLLRAFGRARDHERAVAISGEEVRAATLGTLRIALLAGLVLELLAAVGTALVAVRLGLRLDSGHRILPQALAVLILIPEVFLPLRRLTADFHAGATGRAVLAKLGRLATVERPPATVAPATAAPATAAPATAAPATVAPATVAPAGQAGARERDAEPVGVVMEGVCLAVGGRSRLVLDRIDLRVPAGERVCLVGESGAGKSSLLRVVAGLVAPSSGRAAFDGPDLVAGRLPALGWVPQHPTVLAATVLDNIALGRPGVDEGAVRAALEAVQLGPWLRSLPQGLRTPLSGLDAPLSLGERRRLAMARSLAGPRPRLWLLDEPTAGLDRPGAERLVTEISRIVGGVTAIVATHDPSALPLGQRIIELGHGRILGPGSEQPSPAGAPVSTVSTR